MRNRNNKQNIAWRVGAGWWYLTTFGNVLGNTFMQDVLLSFDCIRMADRNTGSKAPTKCSNNKNFRSCLSHSLKGIVTNQEKGNIRPCLSLPI